MEKFVRPLSDTVPLATWYWLADLCAKGNTPYALGHALYVKAIHGGKAKALSVLTQKLEHGRLFHAEQRESF